MLVIAISFGVYMNLKKGDKAMCKTNEDTILYHYCSAEAFFKIIMNRTLRFSDITKSNDSGELEFIFNEYMKYCDKEFSNKDNCYINVAKSLKKEKDRDLENQTCYVACFSKNEDDLSQWRGYAPNGGFAIGFHKEKLEGFANSIKCLGQSARCVEIEYVDNDDKELLKAFKKIDPNGECFNHYNDLLNLSIKNKHNGFECESEFRIWFFDFGGTDICGNNITHVYKDNIGCNILFYNNQFGLSSAYDIPFDINMIDKIIIGPKTNISTRDIEKMLKSLYPTSVGKIKVDKTSLYYR